MKFTFRSVRREQHNALLYFYNTKETFSKYLSRPDKEQNLVDTFQSEYNFIDEDLRSDPDVKAELHQRVEDLREKLWELSDKRREDTESERLAIIEDKWVEDYSMILANIYITMMQVELDRYQNTRQLLTDYFRDSQETNLLEMSKIAFKVPLVSSNGNPPVDVSTPFVTAHTKFSQKQESQKVGSKQAPIITLPTNTKEGKKIIPTPSFALIAPAIKMETKITQISYEKDPIVVDYENSVFPDIQSAVDNILNNLATLDAGLDLKKMCDNPAPLATNTKEDAKLNAQKAEAAKLAAAKLFELRKTEGDDEEENLDFSASMEAEEKILRMRVERIRSRAIEHLKEFRNKAYHVYICLDELVTQRFVAETQAIKDLINLIKETIEAEQKLGNKLLLIGDKIQIDFTKLVIEPEIEQRPKSPTHPQSNLFIISVSDQFTLQQISCLAKQLKQISPNGNIAVKQFFEFLSKTVSISSTNETVSENYSNADLSQLQQVGFNLDPYETGYINWKKFLAIQIRILPLSIEALKEVRAEMINPEMNLSDFQKLKFQFEQFFSKEKVDRPEKLNACIFGTFFNKYRYFFSRRATSNRRILNLALLG